MSLIAYLHSESHSSPAEDPSEELSDKSFEKSQRQALERTAQAIGSLSRNI